MNLLEHLQRLDDNTTSRKRRELLICELMLKDEELRDISSLRTGYKIARERFIEEVIQDTDPWLYERLKTSNSKMPIFDVESLIQDWKGSR